MIHPCVQEHPWRLADCPIELLAALWEDALAYESPDAAELLEAWHDVTALIPAQERTP